MTKRRELSRPALDGVRFVWKTRGVMGAPRRFRLATWVLAAWVTFLCGIVPASGAPSGRAHADDPAGLDRPLANPESKGKAGKRGKQRSNPKWKDRGGVNPCMTPDPGYGIYDEFTSVGEFGRLLAPQLGGVFKSGAFDLIVHFHGRYPIRKEFVRVAHGTVLVAVDLGISSAPYNATFSNPQAFSNLLQAVEKEMARRSGNPKAHVRKLALSSWSAGYGAIEQILRQPPGKKVDALILLDSVHTGYDDPKSKKLRVTGLEPFIEFAKKASRGQALMYQTHSSIIPPGYASTREVSHHIVEALGGKVKAAKGSDLYGLELFERFDRGGYKVRGYRGNDKPDHCAHLGLMRDVMRTLINPRWKSPPGRKGKRAVAVAKAEAKRSGKLYVVKSGDSLGKIANHHGISVSALRDANGLTKSSAPIQPGDELVIPGAASEGTSAPPPRRRSGKLYVVKSGDSLGKIAKRHGITVAALRDANDLVKGSPPIQPGDELVIPEGKQPEKKRDAGKKRDAEKKRDAAKRAPKEPTTKPGERVHTVAKGQSLGLIAKRYNVTVDALRKRNGLEKGRPIQPGDKLVIPKKG